MEQQQQYFIGPSDSDRDGDNKEREDSNAQHGSVAEVEAGLNPLDQMQPLILKPTKFQRPLEVRYLFCNSLGQISGVGSTAWIMREIMANALANQPRWLSYVASGAISVVAGIVAGLMFEKAYECCHRPAEGVKPWVDWGTRIYPSLVGGVSGAIANTLLLEVAHASKNEDAGFATVLGVLGVAAMLAWRYHSLKTPRLGRQ